MLLLRVAAAGGALIGSAGTAPLAAMTRFGFYLGAAFQIRDDLLNLVGSEERYGKELLGDLREGKHTLMLIHLRPRPRPASGGPWSPTWPPWPSTRPPRTAGRSRAWTRARSST